jgi:hypothetical protein
MMLTATILVLSPTILYLLGVSAVFMVIVLAIFLFIVYYLQQKRNLAKTKIHLRGVFSDLISEISLCESLEEKEAVIAKPDVQAIFAKWLTQKTGRKILIRELVKSKDSLTGDAAQNLRWLYEKLKLDHDSYQLLKSKQWHLKAKGIQQLAEMQQTKYLLKIYRDTNSKNPFVRTEAQIAVVKLTGFKGLRFLNIVSHPITEWQQLCLIDQLKEQDIEPEMIRAWLTSKNETVVKLALRFVEVFKCHDLHEEVIQCLQHPSATIHQQVFRTVKEIANDSTFSCLAVHFLRCERAEQLAMMDVLVALADAESRDFFLSLLTSADETIRHKASCCISTLPEISLQSKNVGEAAAYLFPLLQKEAV